MEKSELATWAESLSSSGDKELDENPKTVSVTMVTGFFIHHSGFY
jgi:hypothetical protein